MIIYSIVPREMIFPQDESESRGQAKIIELNNIKVEAKLIEGEVYEIQRIYSANIRDYLKPELQPGTRIRLNYQVDKLFP
ncbi:MAG: ribonuclease [Clostridiales bacterium]|nr:ribonuclease [Clostridiales bacterium]